MADLIQINDYQTLALQYFLENYKDSVFLQGIVSGDTYQANDVEVAMFEIQDLIYLDVATGVQLDVIGKIWGKPRLGLGDDDYREEIAFKVSLQISGTLKEIKLILFTFYSATYINYHPQYPAKYLLETDATITIIELEKLSVAGVGVFIMETNSTQKIFGFHNSISADSKIASTYGLSFLGRYTT